MSCYEGTPCITDCVMAELEKLGQKYCVALRCAHTQFLTVLFAAFLLPPLLFPPFLCFICFIVFCDMIPILHAPLIHVLIVYTYVCIGTSITFIVNTYVCIWYTSITQSPHENPS
jgi:hypothetical protein